MNQLAANSVRLVSVCAMFTIPYTVGSIPAWRGEYSTHSHLINERVDGERLGLLIGEIRVHLESTTMTEVVRRLGAGHIVQHGDGGESVHEVCYAISGLPKTTRLVLESSVMGGDEHAITGFTLSSTHLDKSGCTPISLPRAGVMTTSGVQLGMTISAFIAAMGSKHVLERGNEVVYADSIRANGAPQGVRRQQQTDGVFTIFGARARFVDARLVEIRAWQITSDSD